MPARPPTVADSVGPVRRDTRRNVAIAFAVIIVLAMLATVIAPIMAATEELGDEFIPPVDNARYVSLFDDGPLPGTEPRPEAPSITGDAEADARLRAMAEARGYVLRPTPSVDLATVDGWPVQEPVVAAWEALQAAAAADGVSLVLKSGYRPVDSQRVTFLGHLELSPATILSGTADAHIDYVLSFSAPPGYSKHHTGYAVDVAQGDERFAQFHTTATFAWMSADDYANVRRHGFMPSYPPGVEAQGPNAESWEYVWVGDVAAAVPEIGFAG